MPALKSPAFSADVFRFLNDLSRNNNRVWFAQNKERYETQVLEPALRFVEAFQPRLKKISPFFLAIPKRVGGSVMRVYRDTRFSKDKTPYKTNVGIHFRHQLGADVHTPGFYVHLAPGECFLGAGIWHPDQPTLNKIRTAIAEQGMQWKRTRDQRGFTAQFQLSGESLKKPPRDFAADHPLVDDLKRKDFIGVKSLTQSQVLARDFIDDVAAAFKAARPFMRFLCAAIDVPC